jgi:hypothetical protein
MESGEAQLLVEGADSRVLRAGDVALLPAGHRHVRRVGTETARWLTGTFALEGGRHTEATVAAPPRQIQCSNGQLSPAAVEIRGSHRSVDKSRSELGKTSLG